MSAKRLFQNMRRRSMRHLPQCQGDRRLLAMIDQALPIELETPEPSPTHGSYPNLQAHPHDQRCTVATTIVAAAKCRL